MVIPYSVVLDCAEIRYVFLVEPLSVTCTDEAESNSFFSQQAA